MEGMKNPFRYTLNGERIENLKAIGERAGVPNSGEWGEPLGSPCGHILSLHPVGNRVL